MKISALWHPARTLKLYRKVAYFRQQVRLEPTNTYLADRQKFYEAGLCWFGRRIVGAIDMLESRKRRRTAGS